MASTLVGIFDDRSDAQRAQERLLSAGIRRDAVQMSSTSTEAQGREQQGGISGFFASLFGGDNRDETTGHYSEAVRRGGTALSVSLDDDSELSRVSAIMEECGAIDVDERVEHWKAAGYTGYDPQSRPYTEEEAARERQTFQVMQEELKVGKRKAERGAVRVHRRVTETPVQEQVNLREERAVVERRPVDRPASAADIDAFKEGEIEIRETSEEPVISKTARVTEEVTVGKEAGERVETVEDTVRRSDVEVERAGKAGSSRYTGRERRKSNSPWAGTERRAAM